MYQPSNYRSEEARTGLADLLDLQDTITRIEDGKKIGAGSLERRDFTDINRISEERGIVKSHIKAALESGNLPKEGTGNTIQKKIEGLQTELQGIFEELTCMFEGDVYKVSKPLFRILIDVLPGYDFSGATILFEGDKVVFLNEAGIETQRYGIYAFSERFISLARHRVLVTQ